MQANRNRVATIVLTALMLVSAGCEDSDVTAPAGSVITLQAAPQSILIDQDAGETEGTCSIIAQITDANGVAFDTLKLRLIEDPDAVEVTGQFTNVLARVQVTKSVNLGPVDPVAIIETVPDDGQRTGFPFSFDGSDSTFDPQVEITCFDWSIVSSEGDFEQLRGPNLSVVTRTIAVDEPDQDLTVTLRVSDEPGIDCSNGVDPGDLGFSVFSDTVTYKIRCDLTDPFLANIGTQTLSLLSDGRQECEPSGTCKEFPSVPCTPEDFEEVCPRFIPLSLTATASDPEDSTLFYSWDCGNGTTIEGEDESVTCTYTDNVTVTRTGSVTVQNDCGRTSSDSFTIQINAN